MSSFALWASGSRPKTVERGKAEAESASKRANEYSGAAKKLADNKEHDRAAGAHSIASDMHKQAAALHRSIGNTEKADEHESKAREHSAAVDKHERMSADEYHRDEQGRFASK